MTGTAGKAEAGGTPAPASTWCTDLGAVHYHGGPADGLLVQLHGLGAPSTSAAAGTGDLRP
jgi:hypothetical protein